MDNKQSGFGIVSILLLVAAVVVVSVTGIVVLKNKNDSKPVTQNNSSPNNNATPKGQDQKKVDTYRIESMRLELQLNDQTKDIMATVDGDTVWFTLRGFLDRANKAGYSGIVEGENSCERIAGVKVFEDEARVRAFGTEVTGDLIDANGNPIRDRIIKLADGRYALPINRQAPCNIDASFDTSPLQNEETNANAAIRAVISSSLRSY